MNTEADMAKVLRSWTPTNRGYRNWWEKTVHLQTKSEADNRILDCQRELFPNYKESLRMFVLSLTKRKESY